MSHYADPDAPHTAVICDPIKITGPMTCRRGGCKGVLVALREEKKAHILQCPDCGGAHAKISLNGVPHYGAIL